MNKVLVVSTGGTISMHNSADDKPYDFGDEIRRILPTSNFPEVQFNFNERPIDSSDMQINNWNSIAQIIKDNYEEYDGFVILHGTDTMAFTGSALSFMFDNLSKPIIITGSQTPLYEVVNDARENLINAIHIAGNYKINEVAIYFNQALYRANRTTKWSTISYNAYQCPNYPLLAKVESSISFYTDHFNSSSNVNKCTSLVKLKPYKVGYYELNPSVTAEMLAAIIDAHDAITIGTYGDGNLPMLDPSFLKVIQDAHIKGKIILNRSQCPHSNTQVEKYSDKKKMLTAGFIPAHDQTIESLICKLLYCLSLGYSQTKTEKLVQENMRGEMTERKSAQLVQHYTPAFFGHQPDQPKLNGKVDVAVVAPALLTAEVGSLSC